MVTTISTLTPSVTITFPSNGTTVGRNATEQSTSQNLFVIWVVVYVPKVNLYYPMPSSATMQGDGTWSTFTYFGEPEDTGNRYDIIAILVN